MTGTPTVNVTRLVRPDVSVDGDNLRRK